MTFKYPILKEVAPAMSTPSSTPIPAGWYPDPAGSFQQRWWTGQSWTNDFAQYRPTLVHAAPVAEVVSGAPVLEQQVAPGAPYLSQQAAATVASAAQQAASYSPMQTLTRDQPASADPLPAFRLPDADQPPQTVVARPNAGNAALVPVASGYRPVTLNADFSNDYQPFGSVAEVRRGTRMRPEQRYTAAAWVLALLPVLLGAAACAVAALLPLLYSTFAQLLLLLAFVLLSFTLAALDRRALYTEGHDSTALPVLALLTPLPYLLARAILVSRETGRSAMAPLVLLLVAAAGIAAALLLVEGLLPLLLTASALF